LKSSDSEATIRFSALEFENVSGKSLFVVAFKDLMHVHFSESF
jgi:hypothetical protein